MSSGRVGASTASANRFGPPWQARVVVGPRPGGYGAGLQEVAFLHAGVVVGLGVAALGYGAVQARWGKVAVAAINAKLTRFWTQIATTEGIHFEPESIIARGDRGEIRWRMVWGPDRTSSVRGVNLMRVQDGRIVEAQGYVKVT